MSIVRRRSPLWVLVPLWLTSALAGAQPSPAPATGVSAPAGASPRGGAASAPLPSAASSAPLPSAASAASKGEAPANSAEPIGPQGASADQGPTGPQAKRDAALRTRAAQIRALMAGTLDPAVSAAELLRFDLTDPALADAGYWVGLLERLPAAAEVPTPVERVRKRAPKKPVRKPAPVEVGNRDDLSPADDLRAALQALLELPAEARGELLAAHRARRAAFEEARTRAKREAATLAALLERAARLEAFLAGQLDPAVEPASLLALEIDALAPATLSQRLRHLSAALTQAVAAHAALAVPANGGEPSAGAAAGGREGPPAQQGEPKAADESSATAADDSPPAGPPDAGVGIGPATDDTPASAPHAHADTTPSPPVTIEDAQARIDDLLARYLALSPQAKRALAEAHAKSKLPKVEEPVPVREPQQQAVEAADRAREEALEASQRRQLALDAARSAKSNSSRLLEEERARLHAIEEKQAREEAAFADERARLGAEREEALAWTERVQSLTKRGIFDAPRAADAERLYARTDDVLDGLHARLDRALHAIVAGPEQHTALGERFDDEMLHEEHRGQLDALWSKVVQKDEQLRTIEAELRWERATELRDAIVALNDARLKALSMSGAAHRLRVTGTGPQGVAAARRELTQVALELRYHVLELPRHLSDLWVRLMESPGPLVLAALQLLVIIFLFRGWRSHANRWLTRIRRAARSRVVQSWSVRMTASVAWYLRRIHGPLDWLALIWLILGTSEALPEVRFVRLVLIWLLTGSLVVLLLDAMASRQHQRGRQHSENAGLRLKSLRLVGLTVVVLGLILSLTKESVGKGTIYGWTATLCWILALPLTLVLVYWWRAIIFERLAALGSSHRVAAALVAYRDGPTGLPAALVGGGYLLGGGVFRWARDQVYEIEAMRRLLAYLVRSQVTRQSRAVEGRSGRPESMLSEVQARFFRPESVADRIVDYATEELAQVATWACEGKTTLTAIVGERGRGKSTFLQRLRERVGDERVLVVQHPGGHADALLPALAAALELAPDASEAEIAETLRSRKTRVVCVDDGQRLVRPTIDGLEQLDRLEDLARAVGAGVSWVIAIDSAAWSFIERAYGDRVSFDQVVMLPRWSESQLGELIRAATERAGLDPNFDDLRVRRQLQELQEEDEERLEHSFYRIIWDASDGNAAVALRYWRHSLVKDPDERVLVRMFDEPPAGEVDGSPLTVLFVLRSLLQMDVAGRQDLVDATHLTPGQVHNALRFTAARGFTETRDDGSVRVTWEWYRPITRVLKRRRLLVM